MSVIQWWTRLPLLLHCIYWIIVHHCAREEHAYHCCYLLNHYTSMCAWRTRLPLLLYIESLYITVRVKNTPTIAAIYWIIIHHCAREEHAYHCCYLLNHHTSMCAWTTCLPLLLYIESLYITLRLELHIFILTLKYFYSHCRVILRTNQMDVISECCENIHQQYTHFCTCSLTNQRTSHSKLISPN
jgi:hypothetical protein